VYETFEHGCCVKSPDLNTLFAEAGEGFFSRIVVNLDEVQPRTRAEFLGGDLFD
jgi:hypothetical protein